jgi:hypothetical protein
MSHIVVRNSTLVSCPSGICPGNAGLPSGVFFLPLVFTGIAGRAGKIPNDGGRAGCGVRVELLFDGRKGTEEEVADIGEDGGAAGGDAVVGQIAVEVAEGFVDAGGGLEAVGLAGEDGGEAGVVLGLVVAEGVAEAEAGVRVGDGEAAVPAFGRAVVAVGCGAEIRIFFRHVSSLLGRVWVHPGCFCKSGK